MNKYISAILIPIVYFGVSGIIGFILGLLLIVFREISL